MTTPGRGESRPGNRTEALSLEGRTALVTGGTNGIGVVLAQRLASAGARVLISGRNSESGRELVDKLGTGGEFIAADMCVEADVRRLSDHAREAQVDILVNNAGKYLFVPTDQISPKAFDELVAVNFRSLYFVTQAVLGNMRAEGFGRVINITTPSAYRPSGDASAYAATKAAVASLTKSWAREYGRHGITVNAVAPGPVPTGSALALGEGVLKAMAGRSAIGRCIDAVDVAEAVLYLAGRGGDNVTGSTIFVDGGMLAGA